MADVLADGAEVAIALPPLCATHARLLVTQCGIGPDGPWRAVYAVAQTVLLQCATAHPSTYERIGGDVRRLGELGCLACDRPDAFGEIVAAWHAGGMAAIREVGERAIAALHVLPASGPVE